MPADWSFDTHAGVGLRTSRRGSNTSTGGAICSAIQPRPDGGLDVTITIPSQDAVDHDAGRVLVVDDEKPARERVRRLLSRDAVSRSPGVAPAAPRLLRWSAHRPPPARPSMCCASTCRCRSSTGSACWRAGRRPGVEMPAVDLRDGPRRVRCSCLRVARRGLPAEAVQRRTLSGRARPRHSKHSHAEAPRLCSPRCRRCSARPAVRASARAPRSRAPRVDRSS